MGKIFIYMLFLKRFIELVVLVKVFVFSLNFREVEVGGFLGLKLI